MLKVGKKTVFLLVDSLIIKLIDMEKVIKVALIAGVTYFAVGFLMKNKLTKKTITASKPPVDNGVWELEMDEYGVPLSHSEAAQLGASTDQERPLAWSSVNGWETSDVIYNGI